MKEYSILPQSFRIGASSLNTILCHTQDSSCYYWDPPQKKRQKQKTTKNKEADDDKVMYNYNVINKSQ